MHCAYSPLPHEDIKPLDDSCLFKKTLGAKYQKLMINVPASLGPSVRAAQRVRHAEILLPKAPPRSYLEMISTLLLGHSQVLNDARDSIKSCVEHPQSRLLLKACAKAVGLGLSSIVVLVSRIVALSVAFAAAAIISAVLLCSLVGGIFFLVCVPNPVEKIVLLAQATGTALSWPFAKLASLINAACTGKEATRACSMFTLRKQNETAATVGAWSGLVVGGLVGVILKLVSHFAK